METKASTDLTERDFVKQLNTKFQIRSDSPETYELELVEVQSYAGNPGDQDGLERFSLFFATVSASFQLAQGTFVLNHEELGDLMIFLVPVAHGNAVRYEAVFNYFKSK